VAANAGCVEGGRTIWLLRKWVNTTFPESCDCFQKHFREAKNAVWNFDGANRCGDLLCLESEKLLVIRDLHTSGRHRLEALVRRFNDKKTLRP